MKILGVLGLAALLSACGGNYQPGERSVVSSEEYAKVCNPKTGLSHMGSPYSGVKFVCPVTTAERRLAHNE